MAYYVLLYDGRKVEGRPQQLKTLIDLYLTDDNTIYLESTDGNGIGSVTFNTKGQATHSAGRIGHLVKYLDGRKQAKYG